MDTTATRTASAALFKQGMRALAAGVTVIAAHGPDGQPNGLTATAVTALTAEPATLLVCVNRSSSMATALVRGAEFTVNVLAADQADIADVFGGRGVAKGANRFAVGNWYRSESGLPLLNGAKVAFECRVVEIHDWSTHHIVIGHVADVHAVDPTAPALLYLDGRYGKMT